MGERHPLDIFRSNEAGFDTASRRRRTVKGKVVASAPRPKSPAPAVKATRAKQPSATRNQMMLYASLVVFGAFAIYIAGVNTGTSPPTLKTETVFRTGDAAGGAGWTIQAVEFAGSEASRGLAVRIRDELRGQGYPEVQVLGYPPVRDGIHASYRVLVGSSALAEDLAGLLHTLRAIPGPVGSPSPFADARVIEVPAGG